MDEIPKVKKHVIEIRAPKTSYKNKFAGVSGLIIA